MKKIISDKLPRVLKSKLRLEKELNVKISNRGKEVYISGEPEEEYIAEKVIDAINFGFLIEDALSIKNEEKLFEIINIKDHTTRKDINLIRGRIIGKQGKTKQTISNLTKCDLEINGHLVGIIGYAELIKNAQEAIISLVHGTKQTNVYAHLEKNQIKPVLDLGLK